jgi:hypothetical protein
VVRFRNGSPARGFFSSIEGLAAIGRWQESDKIRIAALKLTGVAKLFYNGCPELHTEDVTWGRFKNVFLSEVPGRAFRPVSLHATTDS